MAKLGALNLELRVLAHMSRSLKAIARVMEMGITPDYFDSVHEGTDKKYTRNIFIWMCDYYQKSGTLYPHNVFENKLIEVAASDEGAVHARNLELLWGDMQEKCEDIEEDELYDLLERMKNRYAMKAYGEALRIANEKATDPQIGFNEALKGLVTDVRNVLAISEWRHPDPEIDFDDCGDYLRALLQDKTQAEGVKFGVEELDNATDGLRPGEVMVLAAMSSRGKSTNLLNFASNARDAGKNVLYFSFEMSQEQSLLRYASLKTGVAHARLKRRECSEEEIERIAAQMRRADGESYLKFVDCRKDPSPDYIDEKVREITAESGAPHLVVVDYFGKLHARDANGKKAAWEQSGDCIDPLLAIAQEHKFALLTAQQIRRESFKARGVKGQDNIFTMDSLSGDIRLLYAADYVVAIHADIDASTFEFQPLKMREGAFQAFTLDYNTATYKLQPVQGSVSIRKKLRVADYTAIMPDQTSDAFEADLLAFCQPTPTKPGKTKNLIYDHLAVDRQTIDQMIDSAVKSKALRIKQINGMTLFCTADKEAWVDPEELSDAELANICGVHRSAISRRKAKNKSLGIQETNAQIIAFYKGCKQEGESIISFPDFSFDAQSCATSATGFVAQSCA